MLTWSVCFRHRRCWRRPPISSHVSTECHHGNHTELRQMSRPPPGDLTAAKSFPAHEGYTELGDASVSGFDLCLVIIDCETFLSITICITQTQNNFFFNFSTQRKHNSLTLTTVASLSLTPNITCTKGNCLVMTGPCRTWDHDSWTCIIMYNNV